jgi:hypothetical protein
MLVINVGVLNAKFSKRVLFIILSFDYAPVLINTLVIVSCLLHADINVVRDSIVCQWCQLLFNSVLLFK